MGTRRLLVVGAADGNLGEAVQTMAAHYPFWDRIHGVDKEQCDVTSRASIVQALEHYRPTDIVCTVGVNLPDGQPGQMVRNMLLQMAINSVGPMALLAEAMDKWMNVDPAAYHSFVAVSSNSAHIARSESAGYCASKAALSMGIRCAARRYAALNCFRIWGYEPGLILDSPMTEQVRMSVRPNVPLHRIPGSATINRNDLARRIVEDVVSGDRWLNGCMVRLDGGEQ
jgi:NAD(P)-dependent dehydrogenase (short-subunit alcohol dehydrogenase family)